MSRPRGFSLIELVVVMVIAAILAAFAIPRLTDSESKATWFHEQAKAGVRYAQRQAVAQRRSVYVEVQPGQIALCYAAGCSSGGTPLTQITTGQPYILAAPSGVIISMQTGTSPFSFNGLGQSSAAIDIVLNVAGRPITVSAETGYVY
jgi:MSHA pilin protein MshC